jgi:hypothetical protein
LKSLSSGTIAAFSHINRGNKMDKWLDIAQANPELATAVAIVAASLGCFSALILTAQLLRTVRVLLRGYPPVHYCARCEKLMREETSAVN